ncbi:unnamed protein product [Closterium sp. NIES-54]
MAASGRAGVRRGARTMAAARARRGAGSAWTTWGRALCSRARWTAATTSSASPASSSGRRYPLPRATPPAIAPTLSCPAPVRAWPRATRLSAARLIVPRVSPTFHRPSARASSSALCLFPPRRRRAVHAPIRFYFNALASQETLASPSPSPPSSQLLPTSYPPSPSPTGPQVESRCPLCKRRFTRIRRLAPPSHGRAAGGAGSGGESSEREGQAGEEGEGGAGGRRRSARAVTIRVPLRDQVRGVRGGEEEGMACGGAVGLPAFAPSRSVSPQSKTVDTEADAELASELASADLAAAAAGPAEPYSDAGCMECGSSGDERLLLLCDRCDGAAHTYCVGLGSSVPRGDWLCPPCVSAAARMLGGDAQQGAHGAEGAAMPGRGGRGLSRERGGGMGLDVGGMGSFEDSGWEDDEDVEDGDGEYESEEDEDECEGEWSESEGEEEAEDDVEGDGGADGGSSSSVGGSEDESIAARICAGRYTPSSSSTAAAAPARPAPAGAVGSGAAAGSRKRKAGRSGGRRVKRRRTAATAAGAGGGGVGRGRKRRVKVRRRRVRRKARTVAGSRRGGGGSVSGRAGAFTLSALRVLAAGVAARQRQQLAQLRSNSRWAVGGVGGLGSQQASSSAGSYGGLAAAAATRVPPPPAGAAGGAGGGPMRVSPLSIHDIVSPALPCPPAARRAGLLGSTHSGGAVGNASAVGGRASGAEEDERAWRQFERARMAAAALGTGAAGTAAAARSASRSAGGGGAMVEGGRGAGLVGGGARGVRGAVAGRAPGALVPLRASAGSSLVSSALLAASRALAAKQAAPSAKMPAASSTAAAATSSSLPAIPSLSSLSTLSTLSVPSLPPAPLRPARPPTMPCAAACERRALQVNGSDVLCGEQAEQRQQRADDVPGGAGLVGVWGLRRVRERRASGREEEGAEGEWRGAVHDVSEQAREVGSTAVIVKVERGGEEGESGCGMLSSGDKVAQGGGEWRGVKLECCDDAAEHGVSGSKVAEGPRAAKAEEAAGSAAEGRSTWARGAEEYGVQSGRANGMAEGGSSSLVPLGQADCGHGKGAMRGAAQGGKNLEVGGRNGTSGSGKSEGGGGGRGGGEVKSEKGTGSRSGEGTREEREVVVRAVKRYLHPLYTNKTIEREQFKHVARAATHLFWDRMALAASPPLPLAPPPFLCIHATTTCQRPSPCHPCTRSVTPPSPPPSMPTCCDATATPRIHSVPATPNASTCLGAGGEGHEEAAAQGKDMEGGCVRERVGGDKSKKRGSESLASKLQQSYRGKDTAQNIRTSTLSHQWSLIPPVMSASPRCMATSTPPSSPPSRRPAALLPCHVSHRSPFSRLPDHLLLRIFRLLAAGGRDSSAGNSGDGDDGGDGGHICAGHGVTFAHALVCKRWHRLACHALTTVRVKEFLQLPLKSLLLSLSRFPHLTSLDLPPRSVRPMTDALLRALPAACPRLSALRVRPEHSPVSAEAVSAAVSALPRLRVLLLHAASLPLLPPAVCQLAGLTSLHLSLPFLSSLPDDVSNLVSLKSLHLCAPALHSLPSAMARLFNLHCLHLSGSFQRLPENLGQLENLRELHMVNCFELCELPESTGGLTRLSHLTIANNFALAWLPHSIGGLLALHSLRLSSLGELSLLPESLGHLTRLADLTLMHCRKLTALPASLSTLSSLTSLSLACPALSALPASLGQLSSLVSLSLADMPLLSSLPGTLGQLSQLTCLAVTGCDRLVEVPESMAFLPRLASLSLRDTPIALLPLPASTHPPPLRLLLPSLHSLSVVSSDLLASLPASLSLLVSLRALTLLACPRLAPLPPRALAGLSCLDQLVLGGRVEGAGMGGMGVPGEGADMQGGEQQVEQWLSQVHCVAAAAARGPARGTMGPSHSAMPRNDATALDLSWPPPPPSAPPRRLPLLQPPSHPSLPSDASSLPPLSSLPSSLPSLSYLHTLALSHLPLLSSCPDSLSLLTNLRHLFLSTLPSLSHLPSSLCSLPLLSHLHVSSLPRLSSLPHRIGLLPSLASLHLACLPALTALPLSLARASHLTHLLLDHVGAGTPTLHHVGAEAPPQGWGGQGEGEGSEGEQAVQASHGCHGGEGPRASRATPLPPFLLSPPGGLHCVALTALTVRSCQWWAGNRAEGEGEEIRGEGEEEGREGEAATSEAVGRVREQLSPWSGLRSLEHLEVPCGPGAGGGVAGGGEQQTVFLAALLPSLTSLTRLTSLVLHGAPPSLPTSAFPPSAPLTPSPPPAALPASITALSSLRHLTLSTFTSLTHLPPSLTLLSHLVSLRLHTCPALLALPPCMHLLAPSLRVLDLLGCHSLSALPPSLPQLSKLERLVLTEAFSLHSLPSAIGTLPRLRLFVLEGCEELSPEMVPPSLADLPRGVFFSDVIDIHALGPSIVSTCLICPYCPARTACTALPCLHCPAWPALPVALPAQLPSARPARCPARGLLALPARAQPEAYACPARALPALPARCCCCPLTACLARALPARCLHCQRPARAPRALPAPCPHAAGAVLALPLRPALLALCPRSPLLDYISDPPPAPATVPCLPACLPVVCPMARDGALPVVRPKACGGFVACRARPPSGLRPSQPPLPHQRLPSEQPPLPHMRLHSVQPPLPYPRLPSVQPPLSFTRLPSVQPPLPFPVRHPSVAVGRFLPRHSPPPPSSFFSLLRVQPWGGGYRGGGYGGDGCL